MLVQYAVQNYKSIKEEIIINFSADKRFIDSDWIMEENADMSLYKCIGLLGPNASGKTNIIQSMNFAFRFILNTIVRREYSAINVEPFAFCSNQEQAPSFFEFIFYKNKIKYIYGFSIDNSEVLEEYLLCSLQSEPQTLFERSAGQRFDFKGKDVKTQNEIVQKVSPNRLYMPVAAEWGYAPLKDVYEWFVFHARQYNPNLPVNRFSHMIGEIIKDKNLKEMFLLELQKADFNIKDIYIEYKKITYRSHKLIEKVFSEFIGEIGEISVPIAQPIIHVIHENCKSNTFDITLTEDSAGTEHIIKSIAELLFLGRQGGLMLEDELGKTYHTKLIQHFLQMFISPAINPGNLQLLFTTHNTSVLNMLNPDQIYLVDKDETGATIVKLLDDYMIRETDDIELGYLEGRYGSIPYMKG